MAAQLHIEFDEAVGWIISGAEAGPAGTVSLPLNGIRVTVDAVDVRRLVEVTVFAADPAAPIDAAALDACHRLLGAAVANALDSRPAQPETVTVPDPAGLPLWEQVASAARAWFLWRHDTRAPRLAALRLIEAAWPLAALGAAEWVVSCAWEALPAAMALGRFAVRHDALVDWLPGGQRTALDSALTTLTEVLATDQWDGTGGTEIGNLRALLTQVSNADLADLLWQATAEDGGKVGAGTGPRAVPPSRDNVRQPVDVRWYAVQDDLRSRLGDFADEAFAGATARGKAPGSLEVQLPLRVGLSAQDVPLVVARVHTWSGQVLGEQTLRFEALSSGPPRLRNLVRLLPPDSAADRESLLFDGVHVDIAVAGLPPLDADGVRREARGKALRAAIRALVDRHAGSVLGEAEAWASCARLYLLGGDPARAAIATKELAGAQARAVAGRAPLGQLGQLAASPAGPDWASDLLAAWRAVSRDVLRDARRADPSAATPDRVNLLRQLVQDLSAGASGVPELAEACEGLARALLESAAPDGAVSGITGAGESTSSAVAVRESAAALLREALRVRYLVGEPEAAADVARELARVTRDNAVARHGGADAFSDAGADDDSQDEAHD